MNVSNNSPPSGERVIAAIRQKTDTVMLSFSTGKDSIAAWLALRPHFKRIVPVYLYPVPGLRFVEDSLCYYENYFETHIIRLPHPSLWRMLTNYTFMPPERCNYIDSIGIIEPTFDEMVKEAAEIAGLKGEVWQALGVRAADSPVRRASIVKYGAINHNRKTFLPVWDWNKERLINGITAAGVKLPVDYKWFGRSFDGIDRRFTQGLKKYAPDDYQTVLSWFPLADIDIARKEFYG
jgi:hypothetical protein